MPNNPISPQEVAEQLQTLHDNGVINLDAPARQLLPIIRMFALKFKADQQSNSTDAQARAAQARYIVVGSDGWKCPKF